MGISQEVLTTYGWFTDSTKFEIWAEELDYDLPDGFCLIDVDSNFISIGITIFQSGSSRWDPMTGFEKFNESESKIRLNSWIKNLEPKYRKLVLECAVDENPSFFTFVNNY